MFEFMSAMTLLAGLQTAPEQIKIAQILDRYEKVAMEPKALKIEFRRKVVDAVDKSAKMANGSFALERTGSRVSFISHITEQNNPQKVETSALVESEFTLSTSSRIFRIKDLVGEKADRFLDSRARPHFPLCDVSLFKRDHDIVLVKEDEYYSYLYARPKRTKSELRAFYDQLRLVFMRRATDTFPIGALRQYETQLSNYDLLVFEFVKWQVNPTGESDFPIRRPALPSGAIEQELSHDGKIRLQIREP